MMMKDKVAIITGGSSGLGAALARRFLKHGSQVALVARDLKKLNQIKAGLAQYVTPGQMLDVFSCDVSDPILCENVIWEISQRVPRRRFKQWQACDHLRASGFW